MPQKLAKFHLGVSLTEQRRLTHLAVPGLRRHREGQPGGGQLKGAEIVMSPTHPGQVGAVRRDVLACYAK